jgi:SpoVK/Ycf46/Vps4 family AAA+-type ATPase
MENAKVWAEIKKDCFTPEAKAFGVVPPKGILLIGVPGCGKSLFAKALANIFKRPLLRMDMASVKDKWVGGSEGRMKEALSMSEAVSPCVLWIDEIEKAFGGAGSGDTHEVTTSIFGMLLTWMVEKKGDVILVATANNISALRPELISRFSSQFWVGLPDGVQRLDAIKIHLKKNGRPANLFTDAQLAEAVVLTKGFSGREIEAAVQDSINRAWHKKHVQVQVEDLVEAVKNIRPASKVKAAEIEALIRAKEQMGVLDASINHDPVTSTSEGSRKINKGVAG